MKAACGLFHIGGNIEADVAHRFLNGETARFDSNSTGMFRSDRRIRNVDRLLYRGKG